jgi:dual specificity tyrosine-phosphorylation-regulated kinase 2/3/4
MSSVAMEPIQRRLEAERVLGTGTYGQVVRCMDHGSKTRVAVKVAKPEPPYRRSAQNEIFVLQSLQHCSRVLRFYDTFEADSRIHIVTELLQKNLYEALKDSRFRRMSLTKVRDVAEAVLTAIAELHKIGYIHCDIKPENVMQRGKCEGVDDIVMIDFGSVRKVTENQYYDVQSLWYRAPEVMCGLPYTVKIDSWSIGCLLYELHTGMPLFAGENEVDSMAQIVSVVGRPSATAMAYGTKSMLFDFEPSATADPYVLQTNLEGDDMSVTLFRDLLVRLLSPDESLRLTPAEALQHPFLRTHDHEASNSSLSTNWLSCTGNSPRSPENDSTTSHHLTPPMTIDEWDCI